MKKLIFGLIVAVFLSLNFISCDKENKEINSAETPSIAVKNNPITTGKWWVYWSGWDEWGHKSANCGGWGLCNYSDCWFCEHDKMNHQGKVIFDSSTGEGNLIIELNQSENIQIQAINGKLPFNVDDDIVKPNSTLRKGVYQFDPTVGSFGGYKISIKVKI